MNFNDNIKQLKRTLARYGLFTTSWVINKLPFRAVSSLAHFLIGLGFIFALKQRRMAIESLHIAFGKEKSQEEIRRIARECFENFGRGMIELIYFMEHPSMIKERVVIEGREHLERAFKEGKGAIGVSAHFGNFPLMLLRFAQDGYKTNAIIRPTRDEIIEKYFLEQRRKMGVNTVYSHPRKECVDISLRVLRNNELLFIPLDQNFGSGAGVFVDFFGQKAATATGPVIFALRTKAPLIPMFMIREKDDTHRVIIEPPLELELKADDQETILVNIERITQTIERYVRKFPQEWGWMHRRWKSRPKEEKETLSAGSRSEEVI